MFAADRVASRGDVRAAGMGQQWRRSFNFKIAVRDPAHWSQPEITRSMCEVLELMSEDDFDFEFLQCDVAAPSSDYFRFVDDPVASGAVAPVVLFSGGLNSLAGTLEELTSNRKQVILVSHQSSSKVTSHQNKLVKALNERYPGRILHLPVRMNLIGIAAPENSQRTRTFFFSCLAGAVASEMEAPGIRFYENGIMSLNLPMSEQVVGTAATRSTHPRTLAEMGAFLEAALSRACIIDNPFILKTKAEVLRTFEACGQQGLIENAFTCTEVRRLVKGHSHCGGCLQCLHRRFGVHAGSLTGWDLDGKYVLDLYTSPRTGKDLTMAVDFVRNARKFSLMSVEQFWQAHPLELSRLRGAVALGTLEQAVKGMYDLHKKFGTEVVHVIEQGLENHKAELSKGLIAPKSLLTLVVGDQSGADEPTLSAKLKAAQNVGPDAAVTLMIDRDRGEFSLNSQPPLRGKRSVCLLEMLAEQHRFDTNAGIDPAKFTFVSAQNITKSMDTQDDALRRLVERLRGRISKALTTAGLQDSGRTRVIESKQWSGYRLNPSVRLLKRG